MIIGLGVAVGAAVIAVILFNTTAHAPQAGYRTDDGVCVPKSLQPADGSCIFLEYAKTPAELSTGLSNRNVMARDMGMLFVFDKSATHCFWMKDMYFDIDIVWLDADKRIVAKELRVSPDTYPRNYCPDVKAQYVVEVNAGFAADWALGATVPL